MKYTIFGFSQCLMVEGGLNISDAGILRFIVDFYHTGKMRKTTVEGREYIWINYKYVAENLPIIFNGPKALSLRTQKRRVSESLDKLHVAGVIEKLITKDATGTFVFVRIIEGVYAQYIAGVTQKQVTGYTKTGNPVTQKQVTKDYSIKDYSIKDSKTPLTPQGEKKVSKENEFKDHLIEKIKDNSFIEYQKELLEFIEYRMSLPASGKYKTTRGIDGLLTSVGDLIRAGLDPVACLSQTMAEEWLKPKPEYFLNTGGRGRQKQSRTETNKQACIDFINGGI